MSPISIDYYEGNRLIEDAKASSEGEKNVLIDNWSDSTRSEEISAQQ